MNQLDVATRETEALEAIQASQDTERKRALAKVYALLVRLADETDNQSVITENPNAANEPLREQNLVQLALL